MLVSRDGERWREVASGTGSGQLTTSDVRRTTARFLRVAQTGSAPQWWSVADLRVHR